MNTPIRVMLPGTSGEIWTAPAVAPGQGMDAGKVRVNALGVDGKGKDSYAVLESNVPVTVEVEASAIPVCGIGNSPCGTPNATWTLVLEFQAG
ncbi:MAG: hypothetical protein WAM97_16560 [Acidimicrobiales bacterium]